MTSNIEYARLKPFNFAAKILNNGPIIALFDTGTSCSYISYHLFQKVSDKVDMTKVFLQVNTASGST